MVKIRPERVDTQERVTKEILLDSRAIGLVISSEFARKQRFKLKKTKNPIYVRNVNRTFNKKGPIENTVLWNAWDINNFYFILFYFYFFSFG